MEILKAIRTYMAFSIILCLVGILGQFLNAIADKKSPETNVSNINRAATEQTNINKTPVVLNGQQNKWVIVTDTDDSLPDAQTDLAKVKNIGYKNSRIYKMEGKFLSAILFDSEDDETAALVDVRAKINDTAYIVGRLDIWCPHTEDKGNYIECSK
jgi:hypothetical protein